MIQVIVTEAAEQVLRAHMPKDFEVAPLKPVQGTTGYNWIELDQEVLMHLEMLAGDEYLKADGAKEEADAISGAISRAATSQFGRA